ncbi:uncharacterized protein ACWYII_028108 [Salvelinus alpinus]
METEGSVNEAIKLKVILNDNRIEKVILPSQPDSLNELISTLKEKLHLKFDFSLLYEDPDFNNELFNLETIEDLPSPRATVKVLQIRRDADLGLAGVSATELQDAHQSEIVKSSPSVEHLRTCWPALFLEAQVHAEFQRITNQSLQQTFYAALDHHTPRLLTLFREKGGEVHHPWREFSSILRVYNEQFTSQGEKNITVARSAVLAGLPLLLREDSSDVFKICEVGELSNPGILDGVSILSVVGQHNEVVGGIPIRPAHVSIVLEDKIVMTNSCSWPDALMVVFGLLYSLHLDYPKALGSTFEFMQKVFLNLDDGKLKPKLLALTNELLA